MSTIDLACEWVLKTREKGQPWVVQRRVRNIFTNYGLTALASALSGGYTEPIYLAIEAFYDTPAGNTAAGSNTIIINSRIDVSGDTQIVLGVGLSSQETATFTSVTGSGPYTYHLSLPTTKAHLATDPCCRNPLVTDTYAQLSNEIQYDATNFPVQRMQSPGGYSPGSGQWTVQFYYPGGTAQGFIALAGLMDNQFIGSGQLHNHFLLGYNNNSPSTDLEIDGTLTLING